MTLPRMKIKTPVPFPANVVGGGGITVSKANGVWTIAPDFSQLATVLGSAISDPTTKEIWLFDPVTLQYNTLSLAGLGDALYTLTSSTSLAIGTGAKTFVVQSGKDIGPGSWVLAFSNSGPTNFMLGQVTAYSGTSLTVNVTTVGGSGTKSDWTIRASSPPGAQGISAGNPYLWSTDTTATDPGAGTIKANSATLSAATALYISETDSSGNGLAAVIATWGASTSATKARVKLYNPVTPQNMAVFDVTAAVTDNGTWDTLTVTYVASNGTFANGDLLYASVAIVGDKGSTGATGAAGTNGLNGVNPGLSWTFDTATTMAAPASGALRLNNAAIGSVTAIAVSANSADSGNPSVASEVLTWDNSSTTAHRGKLIVRKVSAPANYAVYDITGATVNNTTWLQLAVAAVNSSGSFAASDLLSVEFIRTGDAGSGSIGGLTANQVPIASGASAIGSSVGLASGQLLIGQASGAPTANTVSGDITLSAAGVATAGSAVVKNNATSNLTAGYTATSYSVGSVTGASPTTTPSAANGNVQHLTLNGSSLTGTWTFAPPSSPSAIIVEVTNGGSGNVGAALSTSGFTRVTGDAWASTNGNKYLFFVTRSNSYSHLHIQALQ